MDKSAMYKLTYGLFLVTARENEKDNGCIINTAIQAAVSPESVAICLNKDTYTHDMIVNSGVFNLSILTKNAPFEVFQHFGFQSGREVDKFAAYKGWKRAANGICYLNQWVNAYLSVRVFQKMDLGSHTLFVGETTDMEVLGEEESVTYGYYLDCIKPAPEKKSQEGKIIWRCKVCGYEYVGEELPEDYICPLCKHPASDFERIEG